MENPFSFDANSWVVSQHGAWVPVPPTPQPTPPPKRGRGRPRQSPSAAPKGTGRKRGRPIGAKDTVKRLARGEKAAKSKEQKLMINRAQQAASLKRTREAQNATPPSSQEVHDLASLADEESATETNPSLDVVEGFARLDGEDEFLFNYAPPAFPADQTSFEEANLAAFPTDQISFEEANLAAFDFNAVNDQVLGDTYTNPYDSSLSTELDAKWGRDFAAFYSAPS